MGHDRHSLDPERYILTGQVSHGIEAELVDFAPVDVLKPELQLQLVDPAVEVDREGQAIQVEPDRNVLAAHDFCSKSEPRKLGSSTPLTKQSLKTREIKVIRRKG